MKRGELTEFVEDEEAMIPHITVPGGFELGVNRSLSRQWSGMF